MSKTKDRMARSTRAKMDKAKAKEAILDAAEACFAEFGFDGASVRSIGNRAKINPALVHYYFDSKETLFSETIARRADEINQQRRDRLLNLFANSAPGLPKLEEVIEAIIRPTVELGRDARRGGRHYTTLANTISNSIDQRSLKLISTHYDAIARQSINSIRRVVDGLSLEDAVLGYLSTIRIAFSLMSPTGRAKVLSDGACDDYDVEGTIKFVVQFVADGLRGIARRAGGNAARSS
jgi:AcrR family transcriptional regulator